MLMMSTKDFLFRLGLVWRLVIVLSLLAMSLPVWSKNANHSSAPPSPRQEGLASALNADGSLKASVQGSFDASGYRMELSASGAPQFVAASKRSQWDTQFTLPNGLSDEVFVLLVSGTDIYVGGNFTAAGNINANHVAKFDTLSNTWSALGTGGGTGVSNFVSDLMAIGSDLYVGGGFVSANFGGPEVTTNRVAKYDTTTGTWSGFSDSGGGTGVDQSVLALALIGSDLYVGGQFGAAGDSKASVGIGRFNKRKKKHPQQTQF